MMERVGINDGRTVSEIQIALHRLGNGPLGAHRYGIHERLVQFEYVIGCKLVELVAMTNLKQSGWIPYRHRIVFVNLESRFQMNRDFVLHFVDFLALSLVDQVELGVTYNVD